MSQQSKELVCWKSDQVVPQIKLCFCTKPSGGPPISFRLEARGTSCLPHLAPAPLPFLLHPHTTLTLAHCALHALPSLRASSSQRLCTCSSLCLDCPSPGILCGCSHIHLLKWYLMETPSRTTLSAHPLTPPLSLLRSLSFPCCILRQAFNAI